MKVGLRRRTAACACVSGALAAVLGAGLLGAPRPARAQETSSLEDVVKILEGAGMAKTEEVDRVVAKARGEEQSTLARRLSRTQFSGDFLLRYESFYFDKDARGIEAADRTRLQYRLRFGVTQQISDRVKVGFRLASGAPNARSTNSSFGEAENDAFTPDGIFIDRAFLEYKLQNSLAAQSQLVVGKVPNPFLSTAAPDFLVFDSDLSLEGGFVSGSFRPTESTRVFGALGGFIVDEVQDTADPKLIGGQLGFEMSLTPRLRVGLRASGYQFRSINPAFVTTAMNFGSLMSGFDDGAARIAETQAFLSYNLSDMWPLLVFGQFVKNFSADPATINGFRVEDEDRAYSFGFSVGNPAKLFQIGILYAHGEANSFPAQFPDGATFDTLSNREGILIFSARKLNPVTDARLSYSDFQEIRSLGGAMGPFAASIANGDRKRIVADLVFSF